NTAEAETSQTYNVNTTGSDANLSSLAAVGEQNVINKAFVQANDTITYNGTVWGLGIRNGRETVEKVEIKLNGKTYDAELSRDSHALRNFKAELNTDDFANGSEMFVVATVKNNTTNEKVVVSEKVVYRYDTEARIQADIHPINNGKTIVAADLTRSEVVISGTLTYDEADFNQADIKLVVTLNDKTYAPTVTGKIWSLTLPVGELTSREGDNTLSLTVNALDRAGNPATASATVNFVVDAIAPKPIITLDPIDDDNSLAQTDTREIILSGKVSGDFKVGEKVILTVNHQTVEAVIMDNGVFSTTISASELVNSASPSVVAHYSTKDTAGNVGSAQASLSYSVSQGDIRITLNDITTDNLINVTEQSQMIRVSGNIAGSEANAASVVEIMVNGNTYTGKLDSQLNFTAEVPASVLIGAANYTVKAKVSSGETVSATTAKVFQVDKHVAASIDMTSVDDFSLHLTDKDPIIRISGTAEFEGVYAQGKNYNEVRQAIISVGNKEYKVGVQNKAFFIDIAASELKDFNGQRVSVTFTPDPKVHQLTTVGENRYSIQKINAPEVKTTSLTLSSDYLKLVDKDKYYIAYHDEMTTVSGTVSGTAKQGDKITLTVGNERVDTTVSADNTFSVSVPKTFLAAGTKITATLETQDLSGNIIRVSDQETYSTAVSVRGEKKIGVIPIPSTVQDDHSQAGWTTPYFIRHLGNLQKNGFNVPLGGPQGKPAVIQYYFYGTQEAESGGTVPSDALLDEDLKNIFRKAYSVISDYINVEFVETKTWSGKNSMNTFVHFAPMNNGFAAVASNGGHITWNSKMNYKSWGENYNFYTALHEIGHTLGMNHTAQGDIPFSPQYPYENSAEFSVISYNSGVNDKLYQALRTLRPYDLAYLQNRFGVNEKARIGNDVYTFKHFNTYSSDIDRYIWDGGGVDTFDASKENEGVYVNLTPGSWIHVGETKEKNFVIKAVHANEQDAKAYFGLESTATVQGSGKVGVQDIEYTQGQAYIGQGTQIENLIGSVHKDTLIGNAADNNIYGGAGDDLIEGGSGNDYLDGGTGADTLKGGLGDDHYVVNELSDTVLEQVDEGNDIVYSTIDYHLPEHVENLTLMGTTATQATGNQRNNKLTANNVGNVLNGGDGDDRLIGGLGADSLFGGEGNDTFVFNTPLNGSIDIIQDLTQGDKIELSKTVFSRLTDAESVKEHIHFESTTGYLTYDSDANGIGDSVHFATIANLLSTLENTMFVVV
ncbi:Ig-like domain-containing protein, partial [Glaesserella sp.]